MEKQDGGFESEWESPSSLKTKPSSCDPPELHLHRRLWVLHAWRWEPPGAALPFVSMGWRRLTSLFPHRKESCLFLLNFFLYIRPQQHCEVLLPPLCRWGNWGSEWLRALVTKEELLGLEYTSWYQVQYYLSFTTLPRYVLISNWSNLQNVILINVTELPYIDWCLITHSYLLCPHNSSWMKFFFTDEETKA